MKLIIFSLLVLSIAYGGNLTCQQLCADQKYFNIETKECTDYLPHCTGHQFDTDTNTYYCRKCIDEYVRNGRSCQAITISDCLRANLDSSGTETCTQCKPNFYKSTDSTSCIANPTSDATPGYEENCKEYYLYSTGLKCLKCNGDFYIDNFQCVAFPTQGDNFVTGCIKYGKMFGGGVICAKCNEEQTQGVRSGGNACEASENVVSNCAKVRPDIASNCMECKEGYLFEQGGQGNCHKIPVVATDTGYLENCLSYEYDEGILCSQCKVGYAFNGGACEEIPAANVISDCVDYYYDSSANSYACVDCKENYWAGGTQVADFAQCELCPGAHAPIDPNPNDPNSPSGCSVLQYGSLLLVLLYGLI